MKLEDVKRLEKGTKVQLITAEQEALLDWEDIKSWFQSARDARISEWLLGEEVTLTSIPYIRNNVGAEEFGVCFPSELISHVVGEEPKEPVDKARAKLEEKLTWAKGKAEALVATAQSNLEAYDKRVKLLARKAEIQEKRKAFNVEMAQINRELK